MNHVILWNADDMDVPGNHQNEIQRLALTLTSEAEPIGLQLNEDKTKWPTIAPQSEQ